MIVGAEFKKYSNSEGYKSTAAFTIGLLALSPLPCPNLLKHMIRPPPSFCLDLILGRDKDLGISEITGKIGFFLFFFCLSNDLRNYSWINRGFM